MEQAFVEVHRAIVALQVELLEINKDPINSTFNNVDIIMGALIVEITKMKRSQRRLIEAMRS
jgi:hypothetical protein